MTEINQTTGHLTPEQLNAIIDGELAPAEVEETQQHLDRCHACTLRVLAATQLKAATARAADRFAAPADALARLTAQLHSSAAKPAARIAPIRPAWLRTAALRPAAAWWALAAMILIAVSLFAWRQVHEANTLAAELLDQHLAVLANGATPQVISTDRHTVKPWFEGRIPFSFNLPDEDRLPADTTLRGADLVYVDSHPTALLIFTIHKHQVSVFVTQSASGFDLGPHGSRSGFHMTSTTAAGLRLTGVSDVDPAALDALVADMAKVQ